MFFRKSFLILVFVLLPTWIPPAIDAAELIPEELVSVVDGDSLILSDGRHVRLIGIDAPEYKDVSRNQRNAARLQIDAKEYARHARIAHRYLQKLIANGPIHLEFDDVNKERNHYDKYGRLLAYAWIPINHLRRDTDINTERLVAEYPFLTRDGHILLNGVLIYKGFVFAYTRFDFVYAERFGELEAEAIKQRNGYWK